MGSDSTARASGGRPAQAPGSGRASASEASYPTGGGVVLGRVFGVLIQVDWSLLIIFALVTVSLGTAVFPEWHADWGPVRIWATSLGAAVLFFASVLAHEMSHALVARTQGVPVRRLTLFIFGGIAHLEHEPQSPKAEFLIAGVGPLVSIVIGSVAWFAGSLLAAPALPAEMPEDPTRMLSEVGPLATLLLWLGPVNVLLGVFNLVPGFPLDGGRVLRALLWWRTGDVTRASRWASRGGQAFAYTLMAAGVWALLVGGLVQGLWLLLIGWFLNNAARRSFEQHLVGRALAGVKVRDLMVRELRRIPTDLGVRELAEELFLGSEQRAYPVEDDGRFVGLVCLADVRRLPRALWDERRAADVMTPRAELVTIEPDADARLAADRMARRDVDQTPVLDGGRLVGMVRRRDIVRWLALHEPELPVRGAAEA